MPSAFKHFAMISEPVSSAIGGLLLLSKLMQPRRRRIPRHGSGSYPRSGAKAKERRRSPPAPDRRAANAEAVSLPTGNFCLEADRNRPSFQIFRFKIRGCAAAAPDSRAPEQGFFAREQ